MSRRTASIRNNYYDVNQLGLKGRYVDFNLGLTPEMPVY